MKSKQLKTGKRSSRRLHGVVSTLVRRIQAVRRETISDEKQQAKSGYYAAAIASHSRALTLQSVLNGIKSIQRANDGAMPRRQTERKHE
jgi:hypothetical protein